MSELIFEVDSADNTGEDVSADEKTTSTLEENETLFQFINNFDVSVTITVEGSRYDDTNFDDGVEIYTSNPQAGATDFYVVSDPWEEVRVTVSPGNNPGNGSFKLYRMDDN
jgi:hypothetical protein